MTNINYYTVHRSGCSLKRDSFIDPSRLYINENAYGIKPIPLWCDFEGIGEIFTEFDLFIVNDEIDYSAYQSLN